MGVFGGEKEAIAWEGQNRHGDNVGLLFWGERTCVETGLIQ